MERKLARRLRNDESHRRVSAALAEVAAAAIHPRIQARARGSMMSGLLEAPVASATQVAMETLIDELDDLVETLSPAALDQLAAEQLEAELGIE
jgi:hypothetical protein